MTVGAALDTDELWRIVDEERTSLADLLESLSPEEWETRTRCGDWRVRDVAAHLTIAARFSYGQVVREMLRARGNWNRLIHDSAVREAALPETEIVGHLRSIVGSRRLAPTTSPREPLIDLLVHGQDIALALGRTREMPPVAARDAADRVWTMRMPPRPWPLPKGRLVATDIEWTRGDGQEVRGPIAALLLLLTGRPEAAKVWAERAGVSWMGIPAP
ncbi:MULTISPECIES: maleylpyruvate isomerase family mycothiol-dependent enzyme [Streptomyces]|uniref:maleylpyruvate isomerase family mycothiol-dependent enzyme n=1 Tax=Streptomyces TaxID=1883 RepID=UPI00062C2EC2|nr:MULTISPECIES: maleylpyruvate isomerase family mycothiol-dependent enzyme [Streptomyces]MDX2521108.1 maleylpyruvate isomerase family mycothiol-dependent enzyme [Streptomyces stelliscabiei]SOD82649.1 TIGR03083 family protein [Streptomyces sp. 1222.2]